MAASWRKGAARAAGVMGATMLAKARSAYRASGACCRALLGHRVWRLARTLVLDHHGLKDLDNLVLLGTRELG
jgi:hypothetical protein